MPQSYFLGLLNLNPYDSVFLLDPKQCLPVSVMQEELVPCLIHMYNPKVARPRGKGSQECM